MTINEFFEALDEYYLDPRRLPYFDLFTYRNTRAEGWLQGEGFALLTHLEQQGKIPADWEDEQSYPSSSGHKREMDFVAKIDHGRGPQDTIFQFKPLCLSEVNEYDQMQRYRQKSPNANGSRRGLSFYLGGERGGLSGEVAKDIRIFCDLKMDGYCIAFVYPRPTQSAWQINIGCLIQAAQGVAQVTECNTWDDTKYPPNVFISKLKIIVPRQVHRGMTQLTGGEE